MTNQKQKIDFYDSMRAIAMLSVIIVHVTMPMVKMSFGKDMDSWWIGNVIISIFRIGVPVFLLLSGATMLMRDYKLSEFIKKRVARVLFPFLFWAVAYIVYRWLILSGAKQPHGFDNIYPWLKNLCFNEHISLHFWYIYMILIMYVFLPFLGKFLRLMSDKLILIVLIIWVLINIAFMFSFFRELVYDNFFLSKAIVYLRYSGYLVLGYYLRRKAFAFEKMKLWSAIVYLSVVVFIALYTYYSSENSHSLNLSVYSNLSPQVLLQTLALYFLLTNVRLKNSKLIFVRDIISNYSYGIYLVHIMVIGILYLNGIFWTMGHPFLSIPVLVLLVLLLSSLIIFLLKKIPGGKHIAG